MIEGSFLRASRNLARKILPRALTGARNRGCSGGKPDCWASAGEAASRHQIMDVGMVVEIAGPGL